MIVYVCKKCGAVLLACTTFIDPIRALKFNWRNCPECGRVLGEPKGFNISNEALELVEKQKHRLTMWRSRSPTTLFWVPKKIAKHRIKTLERKEDLSTRLIRMWLGV